MTQMTEAKELFVLIKERLWQKTRQLAEDPVPFAHLSKPVVNIPNSQIFRNSESSPTAARN